MDETEALWPLKGSLRATHVGRTDESAFLNTSVHLDHLDTRLYRELQNNGRASMEELAQAVGLSRVAVRARVLRLLESGMLRVVGIMHPSALGVRVYAHLSLRVNGPVRDVGRTLAALDTIPLVSIVAGRSALIAEAHTADMATMQELIRTIRATDHVAHVETAIYTERIKDLYSPPGITPPTTLDDVDRRILLELEHDGRTSYSDIARTVQYSASTVRARVHQLIDRGVVRICAVMSPGVTGLQHMTGFGVRFHATPEAVAAIEAMSSVSYLSLTLSRFDAIGTLLVRSEADVAVELDRIRSLPGVQHIECWTHLEVMKENNLLAAFPSTLTARIVRD